MVIKVHGIFFVQWTDDVLMGLLNYWWRFKNLCSAFVHNIIYKELSIENSENFMCKSFKTKSIKAHRKELAEKRFLNLAINSRQSRNRCRSLSHVKGFFCSQYRNVPFATETHEFSTQTEEKESSKNKLISCH